MRGAEVAGLRRCSSALEKRDAEELALLRARHETACSTWSEQVRKQQIDEAEQNIDGLERVARRRRAPIRCTTRSCSACRARRSRTIGQPIPTASPSPHVAIQEDGGDQDDPSREGGAGEARRGATTGRTRRRGRNGRSR